MRDFEMEILTSNDEMVPITQIHHPYLLIHHWISRKPPLPSRKGSPLPKFGKGGNKKFGKGGRGFLKNC